MESKDCLEFGGLWVGVEKLGGEQKWGLLTVSDSTQ